MEKIYIYISAMDGSSEHCMILSGGVFLTKKNRWIYSHSIPEMNQKLFEKIIQISIYIVTQQVLYCTVLYSTVLYRFDLI